MKKLIILLSLILLFGCKTKTVLVENIRNTKDSIENLQLKYDIKSKEFLISETETKLKLSENKIFNLIEQLKISENEKQNLKESFETTIKEYNDRGILIKETYSKKTSELQKDLTRSEEKIKTLQSENERNISLLENLKSEYNFEVNENIEINKKLEFLEKEYKELQKTKTVSAKFQWWLLLIGLFAGMALFYYFTPVVQFIFNITDKIKNLIKKTIWKQKN